MSWPAALLAAAVVAGLVCLGIINRPVEVYVWARDVSVCASVSMGDDANQPDKQQSTQNSENGRQ